MNYLTIKALHIIFVVTWFAALFYIVRLFIYHTEAQKKDEPEKSILTKQFTLMEQRLWYIIGWPSMGLATIFGVWMLIKAPYLFKMPWIHIKLTFIILLIAYHHKCHFILKELKKGVFRHSSFFLRLFNEGATVILVSVVFLAVLKDGINWIYSLLAFLFLSGTLAFVAKRYKKYRQTLK